MILLDFLGISHLTSFYDGNEFDISNGTYKDLLAFFQAIGHPSIRSDSRDKELEPYYYERALGRGICFIDISAGSDSETISVDTYNQTGETIKIIDSKIYRLELGDIICNEEFSDDIVFCGISFKELRDISSDKWYLVEDNLESKFNELGYECGSDGFIKVLNDGRQIIIDDYSIEITPVFEYGTD